MGEVRIAELENYVRALQKRLKKDDIEIEKINTHEEVVCKAHHKTLFAQRTMSMKTGSAATSQKEP